MSNEEDPILREIKAAGYDFVREDIPNGTISFCRESDRFVLTKDIREFRKILLGLKIINSVLITGDHYAWVSEKTGCAGRLREFLSKIAV